MKVDPYKMTLDAGADVSPDGEAIIPDQSIIDDVRLMWFYKEPQMA